MSKKERHLLLYWIGSWLVVGNLFVVYRFVGLNWDQEVLRFTGREWMVLVAQASFIALLGGALFGALDIFARRNTRLHRMSFGRLVALKSVVYTLVTMMVIFSGFVLAALVNGFSVPGAFARAVRFSGSAYALVILVYFLVNATLLNFIEQVSEKFGAGQLTRMFLGRYHHPAEEIRVFVFLDLKSSTTYAERLGHIQYSRLIQDFFRDITEEVLRFGAEIYQYVGDEIVLTWEMSKDGGECRKAVELCYGFRRRLEDRSAYYEAVYGFVPAFKVGVSAGRVTVAEVGVTKKEIAYHGDVLNTGSRIQEQCVPRGRFLLCTEAVVDPLRALKGFRIEAIGDVELKGKGAPVPVYSVTRVGA